MPSTVTVDGWGCGLLLSWVLPYRGLLSIGKSWCFSLSYYLECSEVGEPGGGRALGGRALGGSVGPWALSRETAAICSLSPQDLADLGEGKWVRPGQISLYTLIKSSWILATWFMAHGLCQFADSVSFIRLEMVWLQMVPDSSKKYMLKMTKLLN